MIIPRGLVDQRQIQAGVATAAKGLRPDVVRIRYDVGEDWSGEPSLFFRVVLSDGASAEKRLYSNVQRITAAVLDAVKPEELGLHAYFNFRSKSEQEQLREPSWS